jgi:hypothetical protein
MPCFIVCSRLSAVSLGDLWLKATQHGLSGHMSGAYGSVLSWTKGCARNRGVYPSGQFPATQAGWTLVSCSMRLSHLFSRQSQATWPRSPKGIGLMYRPSGATLGSM